MGILYRKNSNGQIMLSKRRDGIDKIKTRKEWTCECCGTYIAKGEAFAAWACPPFPGSGNGHPYRVYFHISCVDLRE